MAKTISICYDDNPPYPPEIEGPTESNIREKCFYYITITDPDNDRLTELNIIFGDGTNLTIVAGGASCNKGWRSGITLSVNHVWKKPGDFSIKAKVKDIKWQWSDWGTFDVHIQKTKFNLNNILFFNFRIFSKFNTQYLF